MAISLTTPGGMVKRFQLSPPSRLMRIVGVGLYPAAYTVSVPTTLNGTKFGRIALNEAPPSVERSNEAPPGFGPFLSNV